MKQICTEVSCEFFQSYEWCKAPSCPYKKSVTMTADGYWYNGSGKLGGEFHPTKPNDEEHYGEYVKVVRCKDCKHWGGETHGCERHSSVEPWWETDFCNYGERKDEVEE